MSDGHTPRWMHRRALLRAAGVGLLGTGLAARASGGHNEEDRQGTDRTPDELVNDMTLDEKVHVAHGHAYEVNPADEDQTGYIPPIPRLNVPDLKLSDGPMGVRHNEATALPSTLGVAASCDRELMRAFGRILGREAKAKDQDVVLTPGMNIVRVPEFGRTFEMFTEDPHLNARTAVNVIEGIQEAGTVATAKHYVANNQQRQLHWSSMEVSDRALREIYLPAFEAAVREADVMSVMAAYNRVNGTYCAENRPLLTDVLKDEWGFDGYVVSDWTATRSPRGAPAGLDVEMPYGVHHDEPLKRAVQAGVVSEERLDDMARRVLVGMAEYDILAGDRVGLPGEQNTDRHQRLARRIAAEGAVLLENEPVGDAPPLPFDVHDLDSLAVVGHHIDTAKVGGGGSSDVTPPYSVSPLEGIRERVGDDVLIRHTSGEDGTDEAVTIAQQSDAAVVFGQADATEFSDRENLELGGNQDELIADVADANDHTVVVLNIPGPILMPWKEDVPTILTMWYPGMEDGNATADVLFGDVTPGGMLPVTFGESREDYPADEVHEYPGVHAQTRYTEGVFVGYRYFDDRANEPLFPFGHGLSYGEFAFSKLRVTPRRTRAEGTVRVDVTVRNVGDREGKEVVQAYVGEEQPRVRRPPRELRAFEKVRLAPGERTRVRLELDRDALSYYDEAAQTWRVDPGRFRVYVGASSRDIRLSETFEVTEGTTYGGGTSLQ